MEKDYDNSNMNSNSNSNDGWNEYTNTYNEQYQNNSNQEVNQYNNGYYDTKSNEDSQYTGGEFYDIHQYQDTSYRYVKEEIPQDDFMNGGQSFSEEPVSQMENEEKKPKKKARIL